MSEKKPNIEVRIASEAVFSITFIHGEEVLQLHDYAPLWSPVSISSKTRAPCLMEDFQHEKHISH